MVKVFVLLLILDNFALVTMRLILFFIAFFLAGGLSAQLSDSVRINSFTFNDPNNEELCWMELDKDYEVFLIGEHHNVSVNPKLLEKIFKHLYFNANARYLLIEYGSAEAYLYNRYLETGDTTYLADTWNYQFIEYREMWHNLYEFNKVIPKKDKIEVIGVDFEWKQSLLRMIIDLDTNNEENDLVNEFRKEVLDLYETEKKFNLKKWILSKRHLINRNLEEFKSYYGKKNYNILVKAINNNAFYEDFQKRDKEMYNNFHRLYPQFKKGKFVGMFGNVHTDKSIPKSFAHKLYAKDHSYAKDHVMTLFTYYYRCCTSYDNENKLFEVKLGIFFNAKEEQRFKRFVYELPNKYYIIDLRDKVGEFSEIVKHYDFMFIIKEQKAATPIENQR